MTLRVEPLWGTMISLDVRDACTDGTDAAVEAAFAWFGRVDDMFSTWRDDSEIARVGTGDLALADASADVSAVVALCAAVRAETAGAYDYEFAARPGVAPRRGRAPLDPSGLVKGWALDRAACDLRAAGLGNFTINAGGDVVARGHHARGEPWRVGIQHPFDRTAVALVVAATDVAVATSGQYEQPGHIVDPATGEAAGAFASVTVVGADGARCDAYATAAVVRGYEMLEWLATRDGFEAAAISADGQVVFTPGFGRYRA